MGRRATAVAVAAFAVGIAVAAGVFFAVDFLGAEDPEYSPTVTAGSWEVRQVDGDTLIAVTGLDIVLAVGCRGVLPVVLLNLHRGAFGSLDVSVQWDSGTPEDYTFRAGNADDVLALLPATDLLRGFRRYDTVMFAAQRSSGQPVRDRFSLRGAADAVDSLPCGILAR